jgi:hypothetical protein
MSGLQPDGRVAVRVPGAVPGGEMRADESETVVFHAADFKDAVGRLERRRLPMAELIGLGEKLAGLLLPGRVRKLYDLSLTALPASEGLRLRLQVEPLPLAALPWEYTFVPTAAGDKVPADFLALQKRVSIVRYEVIGAAAPLAPAAGAKNFRVVLVVANPVDTEALDLEADERAIMAALNDLRKRAGAIESVVEKNATRDTLLKALAGGVDVFHFAGHGVFEDGEPDADGAFRKRG